MFDSEFFPDCAGIYKITNPVGKVYVGQSTNIRKRLNGYRSRRIKDQPLLFNSFEKYGVENHTFEVLQLCVINELNDLERYFILLCDSANRALGLNLTHGGQDYFKHNSETRQKMSDAQRGNKKTLGRKQSKEEIAKRVAKTTGLKRSDEFRAMRRAKMLGTRPSPVTIERMRQGMIGKNGKRVLDTATGRIFNTAAEASGFFDIKKSTLIARLNGQSMNNTTLKYLI